MAAALAKLAQRSSEERMVAAAWRAVAYERSVFNPELGNWPDFRISNEANAFVLSWCHGAPGILLARQALSAAGLADDHCPGEMAIARQTTTGMLQHFQAGGQEMSDHLCCGALGLTSVLRADALASGIALSPEVSRAEQAVVQRARTSGAYTVFSTDTGSVPMPGFFSGMAGIAMALLEAGQGRGWLPTVLSAGLLTNQK
jgi:lantibiotic modifying enzyme